MTVDGFKVTPDISDQWETTYPSRPAAIGRPKADVWLNPEEWVQPIVPLTDAAINNGQGDVPAWESYIDPQGVILIVYNMLYPKRVHRTCAFDCFEWSIC